MKKNNEKIDGFLEIVYDTQIAMTKGDNFEIFFAPFLDKMKELFSDDVYIEIEELFMSCICENDRFFAIEGMKLAMQIMDGEYVPTV